MPQDMNLSSVREKNPARNAEIVRRRQAGEWPAEIAKALGVSRNVVIGALFRAGLCSSDTNKSVVARELAMRGVRTGTARLSIDDVRAIRREYRPRDPALSRDALARKYGVSVSAIGGVVYGTRWQWVA